MAHPQRLLEVTINSAHDLPPMSKLLRTFVVAWVNPETKLSTRVDQHGHTNPVWNCKLVFRVDDKFLQSESSVVMLEIFNVAWLRDLPMGTTRLRIGQMLKNPSQKHQTLQNIALPIRRRLSSGQVQGTLSVSVNVVGGYPSPSAPLKTGELPLSSIPSRHIPRKQNQESLLEKFDKLELVCKPGGYNKNIPSKTSTDAQISPITESSIWKQSDLDSKSRTISSNESLFPPMRPLPSEVASDFKKGSYYQSSGSYTNNNMFDIWTESSGTGTSTWRCKSPGWVVGEQVDMLYKPKEGGEKKKKHKRADDKGLMSCFGNACGLQCKLFCGSKKEKMERKNNKYESKSPVFITDEQNLRKLYF